jgi:predicted acyl esterase
MSDGVKLATDVYLPARAKPPYPAILLRTPYGKGVGKGLAANLCPLGYALVAQDLRGRFDSQGKPAIIFGNDGLGGHQDGHDTIRWVAEQSWSDGKVATWGGSALGIVQNMAAPDAPPALKGEVVIMAFSDYYHQAAYQGGVWRKELLEGWLKSQKLEDVNLPTFLDHPTYDTFWKKLSAEARADQVNAPGVYIGGWYDIFLQGTINSFVTIQERGGPQARGHCFLVIGPVGHGALDPKINYPRATQGPINMLAPMDLLAYWLKGDPDGVANLKPVNYYVMGDLEDKSAPGNFWRSADAWPPPAEVTPFYLHADHTLSRDKPAEDGKLTYRYDPQNPVPTLGGQNLFLAKGPVDQRPVESRPDVLVFTTEPLSESVEVTGRLTAKLHVSSDCPDTDFTAKLCDVDVDLWSTSLIFNQGHRIRVAVSSSNAPRFEPNPNTGDPHPSSGRTRVATNTLFLSGKYPSQILLPLYKSTEGGGGKASGKPPAP